MHAEHSLLYLILGIGLFIYGLRSVGDVLQTLASDKIKDILGSGHFGRYQAVLVGLGISILTLSSSVTAVTVVGLVNAGLVSLIQGLGMVLGANIGTTITGWLLAIQWGELPFWFIGSGAFIWSTFSGVLSRLGKFLLTWGMVFLGMALLKDNFIILAPLKVEYSSFFNSSVIAKVSWLSIGFVFTLILQSSSALLGITMGLSAAGILSLPLALCMVLGENIGSTFRAKIAALKGGANAKRVALGHGIFNLIIITFAFVFLDHFILLLESFLPGDFSGPSGKDYALEICIYLASGHTILNLIGVVCFIPLFGSLVKFVRKFYKGGKYDKSAHLLALGDTHELLPGLAIVQLKMELVKFKKILDRMFSLTFDYVFHDEPHPKALAQIKEIENVTDVIQEDLEIFVRKLMESSLTKHQARLLQSLVAQGGELENIADYLDKLASYKTKLFTDNESINWENKETDFFERVEDLYKNCTMRFETNDFFDDEIIFKRSSTLKKEADSLRELYSDKIQKGDWSANKGLMMTDMIWTMRKIRGHCVKVQILSSL